jgi:diguanylate cyclase (GGDEF)-like protein
VLDSLGRVMDCNLAGRKLAGREVPRGQPLSDWPVFGAALAAVLAQRTDSPALLVLDGPERFFEVRVSDVGEGDRRIGRLLQLRDVTAQHQAQARIAGTLAERDAQLRQVAELEAELREQAMRDPLTGLYNRRALVQRFEQELLHQRVTGQSLTLVLIDIDHFKRINDSFGHATGDAVLRAVATTMLDGVRTSDAVFRVGGEEFALLLPNADALQATLRVQGLRHGLQALALPLVDESVTFSAGIVACQPHDDTLDSLLRQADDALYEAKAGGRNRSVVAQRGS